MADIATLPLEPAASLIADQLFASAFKDAHDKESEWSSAHDWTAVFDAIDTAAEIGVTK